MMIGFIGLGIMGSRMATNLLDKGFSLVIYNRTKEKAASLLEKGAIWADSPLAVAKQADVLFTMLANPQVVESLALGEDGFLHSLSEGKLWADCSTVSPTFSKQMAHEAASRNIRFLDAPVAGTKMPAEKGELIFLVGGNKEDVEEIQPMLEAMGTTTQYQGPIGMESSMKLVINLMLAQSMVAFAEAVTLGESLGLEKEHVVQTLLNGPTTAPFLQAKQNKLVTGDYEADFPLEHIQKDLHLAAQSAFEGGIALPLTNATKEVFALAKQDGLGKKDFSAIYQFLSKSREV
ncbi:NAD(P)-dependent oxidoreductase [Ectobacillus sp. sgz5001026]|uniref:NAD(P)-dependent oxidoreductase n=1 Tax=Ectobacillus sp. sgz5001026 TaxID=3242473 RepID=UPI0036D41B8C